MLAMQAAFVTGMSPATTAEKAMGAEDCCSPSWVQACAVSKASNNTVPMTYLRVMLS